MVSKSSSKQKRFYGGSARKKGLHNIKVTVQSEHDSEFIDKINQELPEHFIFQLPEIYEISPKIRKATVDAIMKDYSLSNITPQFAISSVLTTLIDNGMTAQVKHVLHIYSAYHLNNMDSVLKTLPGQVFNYLHRYAGALAVTKWTQQNPDWSERIITSAMNGTFDSVLYKIRTAISSIKTNEPVMVMLHQMMADADGLSEGVKILAQETLDSAQEALYQSPRLWNVACNKLRIHILFLLVADLERRYGQLEFRERIYPIPIYSYSRELNDQSNTGVVSFVKGSPLADKYDHVLCIGWRYDQWEQFFYQTCLGAVLLLNPDKATFGTLKTRMLEAGVAICYAEEMLEKYLPKTERLILDSPVGTGNKFDLARKLVRKLPDSLLRHIRGEFGSFSTITDPEHFADLTAEWLSPREAALLSR